MAEVVKSCNYRGNVAVKVFEMINPGVHYQKDEYGNFVIVTDIQPSNLVYPEGWYYAKGTFRNKHQSTTGLYDEILMMTSDGEFWKDKANYCTLNA